MVSLENTGPGPSLTELVRPNEATFSASDRDVLGSYWHPVAYLTELGAEPLSRRLLDVRLVVYQIGDTVTVARDLCVHRGASLSKGRMVEGALRCAYHGFCYDAAGSCIKVPAQAPEIAISRRLRLTTFPVKVAYGLVWTCLLPPAAGNLPEWAGYGEPGWQSFQVPAGVWKAAAARQVENFNDVAHLSFVHAGTFGNPNSPQIENYSVVEYKDGLEFGLGYLQVDRDTFAQSAEVISPVRYRYRLTLPFASWLTITAPGERILHLYDLACPVAARETRVYFLMARNYSLDEPIGPAIEFQMQVNQEDRPMVEDQYPEDLPLDLREEVHVSADRLSIAYRKRLVALGLGREITA